MHASSTWDDFERNLIFLSERNFGSVKPQLKIVRDEEASNRYVRCNKQTDSEDWNARGSILFYSFCTIKQCSKQIERRHQIKIKLRSQVLSHGKV